MKEYVYILAAKLGNVTYCKIGYSKDPLKRLSGVQTGFPEELTLVASYEGGRKAEKAAHKILHRVRRSGEWFTCSTDQAMDAVEMAIGHGSDNTKARIAEFVSSKDKRRKNLQESRKNKKVIRRDAEISRFLRRYKECMVFTLRFGKHKGKMLEWVVQNDANYIKWAAENDVKLKFSQDLRK